MKIHEKQARERHLGGIFELFPIFLEFPRNSSRIQHSGGVVYQVRSGFLGNYVGPPPYSLGTSPDMFFLTKWWCFTN